MVFRTLPGSPEIRIFPDFFSKIPNSVFQKILPYFVMTCVITSSFKSSSDLGKFFRIIRKNKPEFFPDFPDFPDFQNICQFFIEKYGFF